jgi:outer membrane biosynthesis protein TonB
MKPSAQTLREAPVSTCRAIPARLLHTLYVFCTTSLMLALIVYTFFLILLLRTISPERASRRGRHVTFLVDPEPSASTHTPARLAAPPPPPPVPRLPDENNRPTPPPVPARAVLPSLSLTVTPRELEPPTPDVAEDPLRALSRICAFLVSNTARAAQRAELAATPPLAGLETYLDAVHVDLAYIDEVVAGKRAEAEEEGEAAATEVAVAESSEGAEDAAGPSADSGIGAGAGVSGDARARDERGLVQPQQAVSAHAPPPPPSQSQSPTPTPHPHAPPPPPIITHSLYPPPTTKANSKPIPIPSTDSSTTTAAQTTTSAAAPPAAGGTRRRKDAVLRAPHASADPGAADADADDAAVRAAALLARFADIGAELEGTVRERGAALWAALSRRRAPLDLPVPPLPRTRSSAALIAARGAPVVEASRAVAHQAAWRARFAAYGRLFGPIVEQV